MFSACGGAVRNGLSFIQENFVRKYPRINDLRVFGLNVRKKNVMFRGIRLIPIGVYKFMYVTRALNF